MEIVNKSLCPDPVLYYTIPQLLIVENKMHILAIYLSKSVNCVVDVFLLNTTWSP